MLGEVIAKDPAVEVRIAAARALGGYKEPQATQPLMQALRDERDLAVRYETSAALAKLTGREPPANAADWEQHLQNPTRGSGVKQAAWWPW
jgi:HEAT repeat protein